MYNHICCVKNSSWSSHDNNNGQNSLNKRTRWHHIYNSICSSLSVLVLSHDWAAGGILPGFKIPYKCVETRRSQSSRWLSDRCDCSHLTFICSSPSCCSELTVMFGLCWVVRWHSSMVKYTFLNLLYTWQHPVRRPSFSVTSCSSSCKSQQKCRHSIICCLDRGKVAVEVRNMETISIWSIYLEKKYRFAPFSENTEATNGALSF